MSDTSLPLNLDGVRGALVHHGCDTLAPMLDFFTRRLGLRIDAIFPADEPRTALLSGHGLALQLAVGAPDRLQRLTLLCDAPDAVAGGQLELTAPDGLQVQLRPADPPMVLPPTQPQRTVTRLDGAAHWSVGRAGLRYRDLLPHRHGGAFIASHIRILDGGPVPDYVHFHKVRFQVIVCRKGWVKVLYEGQGGPITMHAGDCVLQPPLIRHRVLESSAGAEVVELASPAQHITIADHALALPSADLPATHRFGSAALGLQRFVRHDAQATPWRLARRPGFEQQDTGIGAATDGLAGVRLLRPPRGATAADLGGGHATTHAGEFCFLFVLAGQCTLGLGDEAATLQADDSVSIPAGLGLAFRAASSDLLLLEVTLPEWP